ncbi:MAG: DUF1353 domain-containing protein [Hyphomicrobiales bacterium]|nr:DUF1353 domain-containing protein [Hyphomicrobiales bacterium]
MSAFTGSLIIEELQPGKLWRLVEPLRYEAGEKGSRRWIEIPAGFETDGATLPAALRLVLAVWGTYGRAACIHDFGYRLLERGAPHVCMPTRAAADNEFYTAMRACGTRPPLAFVMWAAVRLFGGLYLRNRAGITINAVTRFDRSTTMNN